MNAMQRILYVRRLFTRFVPLLCLAAKNFNGLSTASFLDRVVLRTWRPKPRARTKDKTKSNDHQ
jgi:hypothetical protein